MTLCASAQAVLEAVGAGDTRASLDYLIDGAVVKLDGVAQRAVLGTRTASRAGP
jgi:NAD-dependent DNA ligase